ncbi:MAG: 2OG-Fe(II) oxygenase [Synechococcaceae cyanobacterium]|nr:2OG-Fe(II) oxygenase [Synechococcaceae cyanobacterium]
MAHSSVNPRFHFETLAGRYVVLCLLGSGTRPEGQALLAAFGAHAPLFDGRNACFFAVSLDPADAAAHGQEPRRHGHWLRWFFDTDRRISRSAGCLVDNRLRPCTLVLDERLRVFAALPMGQDMAAHAAAVARLVQGAPPPGSRSSGQAPVLIIPDLFEPALCQRLMEYYNAGGAGDSGFMQDRNGQTVGVYDYTHKRRSDKIITDEALQTVCRERINRRLVPELGRAFQFRATRLERHLVACYDGETGGHFGPHRDNTTHGTAHRRFAVSVVLNSGAFEGGELCFPEYGPATYAPPAGGAVVFSCSVQHQATPVTRGRRFCYLPFLYDEAAEAIRQANLHRLGGDVAPPPAAGPQPSPA